MRVTPPPVGSSSCNIAIENNKVFKHEVWCVSFRSELPSMGVESVLPTCTVIVAQCTNYHPWTPAVTPCGWNLHALPANQLGVELTKSNSWWQTLAPNVGPHWKQVGGRVIQRFPWQSYKTILAANGTEELDSSWRRVFGAHVLWNISCACTRMWEFNCLRELGTDHLCALELNWLWVGSEKVKYCCIL